MSDEMPQLTRFERRELDVQLTYADDSEYSVTYDDLRHSCPCAKCSPMRNEDESSKTLRRQVEALPKEKPKVRIVGNYALGFEWTQGCSSGIFRFERIWDLAHYHYKPKDIKKSTKDLREQLSNEEKETLEEIAQVFGIEVYVRTHQNGELINIAHG